MIVPSTALLNSWDRVGSCKHFFPGNRAGFDVKSGVQINPQAGYEIESDSRGCFRSSCLSGAVALTAIDGTWEPVLAAQSMLIIHAGYMNSELTTAAVAPDYCRTIRFSPGDQNGVINPDAAWGFGMSDGISYRASPLQNSGAQAHVVVATGFDEIALATPLASDDNTYTAAPTTQVSLGDRIYSALGTSIPFFRYAIARKDTHVLQSGAYRLDTGAAIFTNDRQYGNYDGSTYLHTDMQYPPYFRMHGHWVAGAAIHVFDTIPDANSLMLGMQTMAKAWINGDYIITPYWT